MTDALPIRLDQHPVHLSLGGTVVPQPPFTGGAAWYERYGERNAADGVDGRLVIMHTFTEPWDSWEMHPRGEELVVCTAGAMTLIQDRDGAITSLSLDAGEAAINPVGVWHTADVAGSATALFVTSGLGTQNRPR